MLRILYRRPWAVKLRSITTSAIAAGPKTRKKKDAIAFPPRYQNHINTWSQLIQLEIDEHQQSLSEPNVLLSNLVFKSYSVDPMKGHIVEFGFADDFLSDKDLRSPMPVTLLEKFGRVRKYGCILLEKRCDGLKLKLRGASGNQFDPSIADEAKYSIVPSEDVGTMQVVKEFLDLRGKWDKLPGYPVFQTVYRAKPLKSVYVDRKLKFFQDLNERQSAAVCAAMNSQRPIVCIQGPPGTGKTHVLAEIILQANRAKQSVLICAPSHQAVNNIMKRVSNHISGAYRAHESSDSSVESTLDSAMKLHSEFVVLDRLYEELTEARHAARNTADLQKLSNQAAALHSKIKKDVVGSSKIIFATLSSISVRTLRQYGFQPDIVILEEAGQTIECASWLALLQAPRAVLAGDPCQLGPVVRSREAVKGGLGTSLIEFVSKEFGQSVTVMLDEQHRMNESIQKWSSETFYNSKLRPVESVKDIRLSDFNEVFNHDVFSPLVLVDTDLYGANRPTYETSYFKSYQNRVEAKIVAEHFRRLVEFGLPPNDMGIITPYLGQVNLLRNLLKDTEAAINSVDAFQGEQREAILMSLVRNNSNNYVGFLSDFRRMNVSITRAKRHLFLVGSGRMLRSLPELSKLYDTFQTSGVVLSPDDYKPGLNEVRVSKKQSLSQKLG